MNDNFDIDDDDEPQQQPLEAVAENRGRDTAVRTNVINTVCMR